VLGDVDGSSSLSMSKSAVAERLKGQIDAAAANGVRWGSRSTLVATVSHFLELYVDLEVLGSGCNARLAADEVDALWSQVRVATDSLTSHVPPSVACNPPNSAGGVVVVACVGDPFIFV
jgi:hypothetical protein